MTRDVKCECCYFYVFKSGDLTGLCLYMRFVPDEICFLLTLFVHGGGDYA